jgi:hypothetical protein
VKSAAVFIPVLSNPFMKAGHLAANALQILKTKAFCDLSGKLYSFITPVEEIDRITAGYARPA